MATNIDDRYDERMDNAHMARRDNQKRSFDFEVTRTAPDVQGDGLTLEGYAAVFDTPTEIRDGLGDYEETIERGAFKKTISERMPVLQFDHGHHPLFGQLPLGVISHLKEDDRGLFVRARLSDNWLIKPIRDAIADRALTGMSIRFNVLREKWSDDGTRRSIKETVLHELGPVVFPAYAATAVSVRSAQLGELLSDDTVLADLARLLTFPPAEPEAAALGTSDEATDTPPPLAPVGNNKRDQLLREADRMDRLTAVALRSTLPKGHINARGSETGE